MKGMHMTAIRRIPLTTSKVYITSLTLGISYVCDMTGINDNRLAIRIMKFNKLSHIN